jgi:hypothetical protein
MLDNTNIRIKECYLDYFDEEKNVWCYTALWEDEPDVNTDYRYTQDAPCERCAIIAEISPDGHRLKWVDNFCEAINGFTEENDWVFTDIRTAQMEINREYVYGVFKK